MADKPYRDAEVLRELYLEQDLTSQEVADELGCAKSTVLRWLNKHGIEKTQFQAVNPVSRSPEEIESMYYDDKKTIYDIAELEGCSSTAVQHFFEHHDIETDQGMYRGGRTNYATYYTDGDGYERWNTTVKGDHYHCLVHRLMAVAEYGFEALDSCVVHHNTRIPWDNRLENIEVVSQSEHMKEHHKNGDIRESY